MRDSVPAGWRPLFDDLVRDLREIEPSISIIQAKEKFGELRVYTDSTSQLVNDRIAEAVAVSKVTCERCGMPGRTSNRAGIVKRLCEQHAL